MKPWQLKRSSGRCGPSDSALPLCQPVTRAGGEAAILSTKREKPHWGTRKIRESLLRCLPHAIKTPAASTIHAVLDRHGLVQPMGRRRSRAEGTPLSDGPPPNDLWCIDYKGEFQLSDKRYCYPLTITDDCSRNLLRCEAWNPAGKNFRFRPLSACSTNAACPGHPLRQRCSFRLSSWPVSALEALGMVGYIDLEEKTLQPLQNPFGPKMETYVFGTDT